METYILTTAICLIALGIIWRKSDFFNLFLKLFFIGVGVWGFILYFKTLGYIIKA